MFRLPAPPSPIQGPLTARISHYSTQSIQLLSALSEYNDPSRYLSN